MTKSCAQFVKIDTSTTINHDDQKIFTRKDADKFTHETKKTSTNDTVRQSSQKFLQKLRNITLSSITSKNDTSKDNSFVRQCSTEPIDRPKLRSILKSASKNTLFSNSIDQPYNHPTNESPATNDDAVGGATCIVLNSSSRMIKQVRFKEKVSKKRYQPCESYPGIIKLSNRQQKFLDQIHRRDSLNLQAMHLTSNHATNSSEFLESDFSETSEEDLMDGDE